MSTVAGGDIWRAIRAEAEAQAGSEPLLAGFFRDLVLEHATFEASLGAVLARRLGGPCLGESDLRRLLGEVLEDDPKVGAAARRDLRATRLRDLACAGSYARPLLFAKGFQAIQAHRIAHGLYQRGRASLALLMQSRVSEVFAVDIHPAARLGAGILMDHATGVVVGETAVVGDGVTILHGVTLGATGKHPGDRHPKVGRGVLLGAGAVILGNVRIGRGARVGAGSVVVADVPAHCTVAGVPARVVRSGPVHPDPLPNSFRVASTERVKEMLPWR